MTRNLFLKIFFSIMFIKPRTTGFSEEVYEKVTSFIRSELLVSQSCYFEIHEGNYLCFSLLLPGLLFTFRDISTIACVF